MREVELYETDNYIDFDTTLRYENIRFGDYFRSLVTEAIRCGLIEKSYQNEVKNQLGELLSIKIAEFTKGESTSVMQDTANSLFMSILYTVDVRLFQEESHENAIEVIRNSDVFMLYRDGFKLVKRLKTECVGLLVKARKTRVFIEDFSYNNLLNYEIFDTIKKYDESLFSHIASRNLNYVTALGTGSLRGIYFTKKYIENIITENEFLKKFDEEKIRDMCFEFCSVRNVDYNNLGSNVFSLVILTCVFSNIAGKSGFELSFRDLNNVSKKLRRENEDNQKEILMKSAKELFDDSYIENSMHKMLPRILDSIRNNTLKCVVPCGNF